MFTRREAAGDPIAKAVLSPYNCKMLRARTLGILALFTSLQFLAGCGGTAGTNSGGSANTSVPGRPANPSAKREADGVKDSLEELEALITLPFQPEDLVWKEFVAGTNGNVQGRRLLAVFQFSPNDAKELIDRSAKLGVGSPAQIPVEKWFPAELIAQSEMSGDEGIAVTSYPADEFYRDPFRKGTLSNVDKTDFFVLDLFVK